MSIINKANTKKELLRLSDHHRPLARFTRVSGKLLELIEMRQRQLLIDIVKKHPSRGQTLIDLNL